MKAFINWQYYLKNYEYEFFILADYNKHCQFIDRKNLSLR